MALWLRFSVRVYQFRHIRADDHGNQAKSTSPNAVCGHA
jgi:hypothetical protein